MSDRQIDVENPSSDRVPHSLQYKVVKTQTPRPLVPLHMHI